MPGSSLYGVFQARILEWVAISFSGCHFFFQGILPTHVSCTGRWILYHWATREAHVFQWKTVEASYGEVGGGIARGSTGWAFFISNSAHLPRWPEFGGIPSLREETITVFIWSFSWHCFLFKQIEKICHLSVGVFISYLSSIWWSEESLAMLMIQFLIKV